LDWLPYRVIGTAFAVRGLVGEATAPGATKETAIEPIKRATTNAFERDATVPILLRRASLCPHINISRNCNEDGAGDGTSRSARCAGLLNPRTPARPDLKSGAVVLAWLPPRALHGPSHAHPFHPSFAGSPRAREDLLHAARVRCPWADWRAASRLSPAEAEGSAGLWPWTWPARAPTSWYNTAAARAPPRR